MNPAVSGIVKEPGNYNYSSVSALGVKDIIMVLAGSQVDFEKVERFIYKSNQQENS